LSNEITGAPSPRPVTYDAQLAELAELFAELLPDADTAERLELLGVMDADDMRSSLAWLASYAPQVFDFALVRDRKMTERLVELLDEASQEADVLEPYCSACGAPLGIFRGHGDGWHHFRGNGTAASPVELFDAGHEPAHAWRESIAGTAQ
jgi:hypothetical protein